MERDLHGLELSDAIIEVFHALEECSVCGDNYLDLVHGYHHGSVLRTYFRSKRFLKDVAKEGFYIKKVNSPNPGITRFFIKVN